MATNSPTEIPTLPRDIVFSAIDISAHPHPEGSYVDLFKAAKRGKIAVKISGYEYGSLSKLSYVKENDEIKWITGHIWRFIHIDKSAPWVNLETEEEVDPKEKKEKLSLPDNWAPNSRRIFWAFNVEEHLLVFVRRNVAYALSPLQAEKFFRVLMDVALKHVPGVETVDVNAVKSAEKIKEIFEKRVAKLEITVTRPNPDGADGDINRVFQRLQKIQASKKTDIFTALPNKTIIPDEQMKDDIAASQRSGRLKAVVYDEEEKRDEVDTQKHPFEKKETFDPKAAPAFGDFILRVAAGIVLSLARKRK